MPPVSALSAALQQPPGQQSADAAHQKPEFSGFPCLGNDQANGSPDDNQFPEVSRASIAGSAPTAVLLRDGSIAVSPLLRCICLHLWLSLKYQILACICAYPWRYALPGNAFLAACDRHPVSPYTAQQPGRAVSFCSPATQGSQAMLRPLHKMGAAIRSSTVCVRLGSMPFGGQPGPLMAECCSKEAVFSSLSVLPTAIMPLLPAG